MSTPYRSTIILSVVCLHCLGATLFAQSQQLTYEDISSPVLPQNGDWVRTVFGRIVESRPEGNDQTRQDVKYQA